MGNPWESGALRGLLPGSAGPSYTMVAEWSSRASGRRQGQRQDLEALKERLLIPELWRRLGLPGQPGKSCRSPFRPDRSPSFALYDGGRRWHDHGTGEGGDAIDFLAQACHLDKAEATRRFLSLLGISMMTEEAPAGRGHTSGDGQRRGPETRPPRTRILTRIGIGIRIRIGIRFPFRLP